MTETVENAATLAKILVGESPTSRDFPVATVVIATKREGDLLYGS